ncbi:uncharacterized protein [Parasteatoda tepidariorum]|uniref:uncharacterized protein isoform X1 n=2 Tax=Parasteatoda tepidariorum TaxID=114398 RepID=UPI0039BC761D
MLGIDGEIVCEESHVTSDDENDATDSDEMEELSAEIQQSESSTTDDEDVEMLNSDDLVELSSEMEMKESSSSDVIDVAIVDSDDLVELSSEMEMKESSSSDVEDIAIVDSGEKGELNTEVEPMESNMILDKEEVLMKGSGGSDHWYFEIDLREKKLLAKSNKIKESLNIVVGLQRCGDVSRLTKNLEEKLAQNPDFAEKREMARKKEKKGFRYILRRLFSGCFTRK